MTRKDDDVTDHIKPVTLTPAEQMREAAAQVAVSRKGNGWDEKPATHPFDRGYIAAFDSIAAAIRALPLPPEPEHPITLADATAYEKGLEDALKVISSLGYGGSEDVDEGHEQAYRAVERYLADWRARAPQADQESRIRAAIEPRTVTLADALAVPEIADLVELVKRLGLREIVAGWNGEGLERPYKPHPERLGATIKTTCGTVYSIDATLAKLEGRG